MRNYPRIYTSFMPNAPILNGVPGSLLDIIKKCKIGGWTPFDVTKIEVLNGLATFYFNYTNCNIPAYSILTFTGCDEPLLNNTFTVITGGSNKAIFETTVADGTYLGSIKAVPEAAGWELMFSGTNRAVIRSGNLESSRTVVQITDTQSTTCQFEFGSDATSVTNIIDNTLSFNSRTKNILKSRDAVANNWRGWFIVTDNTTTYIFTDVYTMGATIIPKDNLVNALPCFYGDYLGVEDDNETPFAFSFNGNNPNDTYYNTYAGHINQSNVYYNYSDSNYENTRSLIRTTQFRVKAWAHAFIYAQVNSIQNTWRWSGGASKYSLYNLNKIESFHKDIPVHTNPMANSNLAYMAGKLPGIKFSEIALINIYNGFTTSKDELTGDIYLYLPTKRDTGYTLNVTTDSGMVPFIMNKKWGT